MLLQYKPNNDIKLYTDEITLSNNQKIYLTKVLNFIYVSYSNSSSNAVSSVTATFPSGYIPGAVINNKWNGSSIYVVANTGQCEVSANAWCGFAFTYHV